MDSNKNKIFAVIAIGVLLLLLIGSTFAYFAAQGGDASQTDVNVLTHTVDSLAFETGDALSITADQNTFAQGKGNQTDSTFARATLKANSSSNTATDHYYVYLSIDENTFEYTTESKTAELILTVNKVEGETKTPVTTIDGLNYVTVGSVSGFDITEYDDLITIANNYEITSTGTKIDEWEVTLTLVNLDSNQSANAGKTFNAQLLIQKQPVAAQFIKNLYTTQGANNLYHHDGTITDSEGNILDAEDGSYRYAGGDYSVATAYQNTYKRVTSYSATDTESVIGFVCDGTESYVGSTCSTEKTHYYYLRYDIAEQKTQYSTYQDVLEKAVLDGYVDETMVKNYVCFGDDCTNTENLYRIIGVYNNNLKLIKMEYANADLLGTDGDFYQENSTTFYSGYVYQNKAGFYYWNNMNKDIALNENKRYNIWSYSELNKTNLNKNYLNNIGDKWANMITEAQWYGDIYKEDERSSNGKEAYKKEFGINRSLTSFEPYNAKVGLIYASEYLYGSLPNYWNLPGYAGANNPQGDSRSSINDNWLYSGGRELTISSQNLSEGSIHIIHAQGVIYHSRTTVGVHVVRPTFYLKSSVTFAGGTGTSTDPYRIA